MIFQSKWTNSTRFIFVIILTSLILYLAPLTSYAANKWTGNLPDGTRVELSRNATIDTKKYDFKLHYLQGSSRNWVCSIGANKRSLKVSNPIELIVEGTNGGTCECLMGAKMIIQLSDNQPKTVEVEAVYRTDKLSRRCKESYDIDCSNYKQNISLK